MAMLDNPTYDPNELQHFAKYIVSTINSSRGNISFSPKTVNFDQSEYNKLAEMASQTGYQFTAENGQLRFGPPLSWKKDQPPPRGTEVFICQIPRDFKMCELLPYLRKIANFYDVRMMLNFSKLNKGFAFCRFLFPSDAAKAITILNDLEIDVPNRNGITFKLVVVPSLDKTMLSIYPVPSKVTLNQINQLLIRCEIDENCIKYIGVDENVYRKGVKWLISFDEHRSAALAKRKLMSNKNIWTTNFTVEFHSSSHDKSPSSPPPSQSTTTSADLVAKPLLQSPPLLLTLPRPLTSKKKKFAKSSGGSCFPPGQRTFSHSHRSTITSQLVPYPTKMDNLNFLGPCGSTY